MLTDLAELPKHLVDSILKKVESSIDYLRYGVSPPKKIIDSIQILKVKILIPYGKRFSGSLKRWLTVVNEDYTLAIYKPFSTLDQANIAHARICFPCLFPPDVYELEPQLPPQLENPEIEDDLAEPDEDFELDDNHEPYDPAQHCDHHVQKVVITADPVENANECTIVVIFGERCQVALIRLSKDKTWTKINDCEPIDDILYCKNQFYALSYLGELMSFGVTKSGDSTIEFITPENPSFEYDS
ncbi:hypothetical protein PanWU01x14_075680 [Parasponia andersonii]|uniref:KIB1-4 beta-propeller domain-containing protein n=1 Tax=Parasponia andersonii TaxID=3476 RepID=A0A2P5DCW0_PARAD|nr:hypothetical protein PanWU01x14_075680 [Parasponia andersonii]